MFHEARILLGMAGADLLIIGGWWFLCSRLVPGEVAPDTANAEAEAEKGTTTLHRVLTWVCFFLLIGLIVECVGLMPAILVRFGWS